MRSLFIGADFALALLGAAFAFAFEGWAAGCGTALAAVCFLSICLRLRRGAPVLASLALVGLLTPAPVQAWDGHFGLGVLWHRNPRPAQTVTLQAQLPCAACVATPVVAQPAPVTLQLHLVQPLAQPQFQLVQPQVIAPAPVAPAPAAQQPIMLQVAPAPAPPPQPDRYWLLRLDAGGTMYVTPANPR